MENLNELVEELKDQIQTQKKTFAIYKRSLPPEINKKIASNLPSHGDACKFLYVSKLKDKEVMHGYCIYYKIVEENKYENDIYRDNIKITVVGNNKKLAGIRYFGLEEEEN